MTLHAWLLALSLLQVTDVGTSFPLWERGYSEVNPMFYHRQPVVASMQVSIGITAEWYLAQKLEKKHPKVAKVLIIAMTGFAAVNVVRNVKYLHETR